MQQQQSHSPPSSPLQKMSCIRSVIYLSTLILMTQAIGNTVMQIMSQFTRQNGNDWAGPLSTGMVFIGSGLGALFALKYQYIDRVSYKFIFMIGSLGNATFVSLVYLFLQVGFTQIVEVVFLLGSFLAGLVTSIFYIGQFNYVNTCGQIDNQTDRYFGISLCFVQSANLLGNGISAGLIEPLGQKVYSLTMSCAIIGLSFVFLTVKNYKYSDVPKEGMVVVMGEGNMDREQIDGGDCDGSKNQMMGNKMEKAGIDSISINDSFSHKERLFQKNEQNLKQTTVVTQIQASQQIPQQQKFPKILIFIFCFSGVILSFVYSELSVIYYQTFNGQFKEEKLNQVTFVAFVIEGIGEMCGGLSVALGKNYIHRFGHTFILIAVANIFMFVWAVILLAKSLENLWLMDLCCFFVGYCDCTFYTIALTVAGKWTKYGMLAFNFGQALTVGVTALIVAFTSPQYVLIWGAFMHILSSIAILKYEEIVVKARYDYLEIRKENYKGEQGERGSVHLTDGSMTSRSVTSEAGTSRGGDGERVEQERNENNSRF